jgi:hypothetical protein
MKHGNVNAYDSLHWNWSTSCVCDDAIYIACCSYHCFEGEMLWRNARRDIILVYLTKIFRVALAS